MTRVESALDHQTSALSSVEVRSALRRKKFVGDLTEEAAHQVWQQFQVDIQSGQLTLLPLTHAVLEEAVHVLDSLPNSVPLRALDALHLATLRVFDLAPLATNDTRMIVAAQTLGVALA